jgi:hypothetical protein
MPGGLSRETWGQLSRGGQAGTTASIRRWYGNQLDPAVKMMIIAVSKGPDYNLPELLERGSLVLKDQISCLWMACR